MSRAILVLEQPWWNLHHDPSQTSVRHFLEGLARLEGLPIFHSTFYDTASLGQAMQYLMDARKLDEIDQLVVYVAAHGCGARIGNGRARGTNLATVFDRIQQYGKGKVVGVLLDSCEVGGQSVVIERGMQAADINWVIGYTTTIDWLTTMLINIHVLSVMCRLSRKGSKKPSKLRGAVREALELFNPHLFASGGDDEDESEDDELRFLSSAISATIRGDWSEPEKLRGAEIWPALTATDEMDLTE